MLDSKWEQDTAWTLIKQGWCWSHRKPNPICSWKEHPKFQQEKHSPSPKQPHKHWTGAGNSHAHLHMDVLLQKGLESFKNLPERFKTFAQQSKNTTKTPKYFWRPERKSNILVWVWYLLSSAVQGEKFLCTLTPPHAAGKAKVILKWKTEGSHPWLHVIQSPIKNYSRATDLFKIAL